MTMTGRQILEMVKRMAQRDGVAYVIGRIGDDDEAQVRWWPHDECDGYTGLCLVQPDGEVTDVYDDELFELFDSDETQFGTGVLQ